MVGMQSLLMKKLEESLTSLHKKDLQEAAEFAIMKYELQRYETARIIFNLINIIKEQQCKHLNSKKENLD